MLRRIQNSLLFSWATLVSAIVSAVTLVSILIRRKSRDAFKTENRSTAFLANKWRAMAFYRVFSNVYDFVNVHFYTDEMRNRVIKSLDIRKGSFVLDVGCGTGYTTQAVLERLELGEMVGIDLTPKQLDKAARNLRTKTTKLSLFRGDAENLPFKENAFDAVLSVGAIEYFPNPQKAVREMTRVAKAGGSVVVGAPESVFFRKVALNRILYTPSLQEVEGFFTQAKLKGIRSVLTGVNTFFGTSKYVVIAVGNK